MSIHKKGIVLSLDTEGPLRIPPDAIRSTLFCNLDEQEVSDLIEDLKRMLAELRGDDRQTGSGMEVQTEVILSQNCDNYMDADCYANYKSDNDNRIWSKRVWLDKKQGKIFTGSTFFSASPDVGFHEFEHVPTDIVQKFHVLIPCVIDWIRKGAKVPFCESGQDHQYDEDQLNKTWDSPQKAFAWCTTQPDLISAVFDLARANIDMGEIGFASELILELNTL